MCDFCTIKQINKINDYSYMYMQIASKLTTYICMFCMNPGKVEPGEATPQLTSDE